MKIAIITAAGVSSRFNEGIIDSEKQLKVIYQEKESPDTLLLHLVRKCAYADEIILVGGYKYEELKNYVSEKLPANLVKKITLVFNPHFHDLASGYSFYMGLSEALRREDVEDILFVEGDLDIDEESFQKVAESQNTVLTYNREPIYSNKAVVLYQTGDGAYHYAFNSAHGLLTIEEPVKCILNSGQLWKFTDIDALSDANQYFAQEDITGTNLLIIQRYLDALTDKKSGPSVLGIKKWANCNTREDFHKIREGWQEHEAVNGKI